MLLSSFSGNIEKKNLTEISNVSEAIASLNAAASTEGTNSAKCFEVLQRSIGQDDSDALCSLPHKDFKKGTQFMNTLNLIDDVYQSIPTANIHSAGFMRKQKSLLRELLLQQRDRIKIAKADAYTKIGREKDALASLNEVIERDCYLLMHRALDARGALLQIMGETLKSETDFRESHRLKKKALDIPSINVNTQRCSF